MVERMKHTIIDCLETINITIDLFDYIETIYDTNNMEEAADLWLVEQESIF